jgi:hypothetical protein
MAACGPDRFVGLFVSLFNYYSDLLVLKVGLSKWTKKGGIRQRCGGQVDANYSHREIRATTRWLISIPGEIVRTSQSYRRRTHLVELDCNQLPQTQIDNSVSVF